MRNGWLKELQDKNRFKVVKVPTEKNLADIMTKPLTPIARGELETEHSRTKALVVGTFRGQVRVST